MVAEMAYGAFSEWGTLSAKHALPVPVLAPEVIALLTSGLTASIGTLFRSPILHMGSNFHQLHSMLGKASCVAVRKRP